MFEYLNERTASIFDQVNSRHEVLEEHIKDVLEQEAKMVVAPADSGDNDMKVIRQDLGEPT